MRHGSLNSLFQAFLGGGLATCLSTRSAVTRAISESEFPNVRGSQRESSLLATYQSEST